MDRHQPPGRRLENDPDFRAGWIAGHFSRVRQGRYKVSALPRVNELLECSESAGLAAWEISRLVELRSSLATMEAGLEPEAPEAPNRPGRHPGPVVGESSPSPAVQEAEQADDVAERRASRDKGRVNFRTIRSRPPAGRDDSGAEEAGSAPPGSDDAGVDPAEERRRELEGALKDMLPSGLNIRVVHSGSPPPEPGSEGKRRPSRGDIGW